MPEAPRRRVRTPTVLQMEATECGAAALAIILAHHGRMVPLEELRQACGVSRDGAKAANLLKAARSCGLEATGHRMELEAALAAPVPAILFWGFNHFLVLEGVAAGRIHLNDPAGGPRTVTREEFSEAFTGVVLQFRPGPAFRKGGERPKLLAALVRRLASSREALLYALLAGLLQVAAILTVPSFVRVLVDRVLLAHLEGWLQPLITGLAGVTVLAGALSGLQRWILNRMEIKLSVTTMSGFFWHMLRLPVPFYTQRFSGEIASRVDMNLRIARFLCDQLVHHSISLLLVLLYAALMLAYDPWLTLVALAAVGVLAGATVLANRKRVDGSRRFLQEAGKARGTLMGGLAALETLKATGTESDLFGRWAGYQAKAVNARQESSRTTQVFLLVPPLLTSLVNAAVLALGAQRVIQGQLSVGQLVAFQFLLAGFLAPVNTLAALAGDLQEMEGVMNRLDDVVRNEVDPQVLELPEAGAPRRLSGHVSLEGLTFGYSALESPFLKDFHLQLRPGSRVALVGPSGCGKSTVARIVTGLQEPWSGTVRFDGRPRREWPRALLASSLALVDQEVSLFEGSVRENLTLWDATVPEPVLVRACIDACIHDEIASRRGGYDSPVLEGGVNFSGGQRQRLEIARALVGDPRVLVLDEATSALDPATEQLLDRNLRRRGCTCLIIAHRLSTIRDADEIIVLDRGRTVERGPHASLMASGGLYAQLAESA